MTEHDLVIKQTAPDRWTWRCWGSDTCAGGLGVNLFSEDAARNEASRQGHVTAQ